MGKNYMNVFVMRGSESRWKEFLDKLVDIREMREDWILKGYDAPAGIYNQDEDTYKTYEYVEEFGEYRGLNYGVRGHRSNPGEYILIIKSWKNNLESYMELIGYRDILYCYHHDEDSGLSIVHDNGQQWEYISDYELETTAGYHLSQNIGKFIGEFYLK